MLGGYAQGLWTFWNSKKLFLIFSLINSREEPTTLPPPPPMRQLPISYIRAFAYHPVAFPQPLAPITTYQVSRNPQSYANRNLPSAGIGNAIAQAFQQQFMMSQDQQQQPSFQLPTLSQPPTQQQLPQNPQVEFGTPPSTTSTTTTTTTTAAPVPIVPVTQPPPAFSQPIPQVSTRSGFSDGYQRQIPFQQMYQSGNFGGFPQVYNNPYSQPYNQFQYNDIPSQFSGRGYGAEPAYQQYASDPLTYQFIPTSITPIQNNVKFVPCMCPVAVQISPPLIEKRSEETPILAAPAESESVSQSPAQQDVEENLWNIQGKNLIKTYKL